MLPREVAETLHNLFRIIDNEDFDQARQVITKLTEKIGDLDPEITHAKSLIKFLED